MVAVNTAIAAESPSPRYGQGSPACAVATFGTGVGWLVVGFARMWRRREGRMIALRSVDSGETPWWVAPLMKNTSAAGHMTQIRACRDEAPPASAAEPGVTTSAISRHADNDAEPDWAPRPKLHPR